mgnify:CR=1 FL=1
MIANFNIPLEIQSKIKAVERKMLSQTDGYHPDLKAALEVLLASGGKRIRPLIILLIGAMLNGPEEEMLSLATAIELLHTATLVHDDLIDGALLRRGHATLNAHWSPAATVLTGDFLFSCSATLAANTNHLEIIKLFSSTLTVIVNGEINQLFSSRCNPSKENYFQRIYEKTSSLFQTSAQSAALLSNATLDQVSALKQYGYNLGMAFQIIDDMLDYVSNEKALGKPVGSDLREGLITMPMIFFIESHPDDPAVNDLLQQKCIEKNSEFERIISEINQSDAISKTLSQAKEFAEKAIDCLKNFTDSQYKSILISLANYTIERSL